MFARREPHLARPLANAPVEGVDLEIGDPQGSDKGRD